MINRVLHVVIPVAFFVGALHAQDQIDPSRPIPAQHPTTVRAGAAAVEPIPRLASPTGQFGIGRIGYDWTDPVRLNRFPTGRHVHRELMVYLWYPSAPKGADMKGAYFPGAKQVDLSPEAHTRMTADFGANWPLIISGAIYSHAEEGAPAAKSDKPFPVVVFSHGKGSTGFGYTSLIEDLVSHGYVVASIEHTGSAPAVLFQDGIVVLSQDEAMPAGLSPDERFARMAERSQLGSMRHIKNKNCCSPSLLGAAVRWSAPRQNLLSGSSSR